MQKVDRKAMLEMLEVLRPAVSGKDMVEHADSFTFKDGLAWGYNDEIAISHPLPEGLELVGAVLAEPLVKFLGKVPDAEVILETSGDELRIRAGKCSAGMPLKVSDSFPVESIPMPKQDGWDKLPEGTIKALSLAARSASTDLYKPILTNVHVGKGKVAGCDNYSLTVCDIAAGPWPLLPAAAVKHLSAFDPDMVAFTEGWTHFANAKDCVLSCRVGTGEYPDISGLLKVTGEDIEFPKELSEVLERAGIFTRTEFDTGQHVSLSAKGSKLKVEGRGPMGWFEETIPFGFKGEFTFSVHPEHISAAMDFGRNMTLGKNALLIKGKGFTHVVAL